MTTAFVSRSRVAGVVLGACLLLGSACSAASAQAEPRICEELRSKLIDARHRTDRAQEALSRHPASPDPQKDAVYIRLEQARDQIRDEAVAYFDLLMLAGCSEIAPPEPKPQDANQTPAAPQTTTTASGENCDSLQSLFRMTSAQLNGEEQRYIAVLNSPGSARRPEVRQAAARIANTRNTLRLILSKMTRAGCSTIPEMPPSALVPDPDPEPEPGPSQAQPDPSPPKPQRTRQADCEIMRGKARAVLNSALQIENLINYSALMQLYADIYRLLILGGCETDDLPKADPPTRRAGPAAPTPSCDDLLAAFRKVETQLHDAEAVFERDRLSVDPTTQVIAGEAYGNIRARRGELEIIRRNMQQASCTYLPGLPPSQSAGTTPLGTPATNSGSNPTPTPVGPGLFGGSTPRVPPGPPPAPAPPGLLGGATPPALPPMALPPIKLGSPPGPTTAALPPVNLPPPKVTPPSPPPTTPAAAPPDDFVTHTLSQPFTPGGFCPNKSAFEACKFGPKDASGKPSEGWVGCVDPRDENFACKGSGAKPNCSCTQDHTGKVPPRDQLIAMAPKAKKHTPLSPVALPQITLPEPGPMVHPQPAFIPPYSGPTTTVHSGKPRINVYTPTHPPRINIYTPTHTQRVNVHTPGHTPRINIYRPNHTPRINVFRPSHTPRVNVFRHSGHTTGRRRH
jgi:hypothetical protein